MSAGAITANLTTLVAIDMTGVTTGFMKVASQGYGDYIYDPLYSGAFNSPFIVEHTGTGTGAWLASGVITHSAVPTGITELAVMVMFRDPSSTVGFDVEDVYTNGGGGSSVWRREIFS